MGQEQEQGRTSENQKEENEEETETITDTGKFKLRNTSGTAPVYPSGFGVAGHSDGVILSFYFNPPEDKEGLYVLSRLAMPFRMAEDVAKTLKEAVESIKKQVQKGASQASSK